MVYLNRTGWIPLIWRSQTRNWFNKSGNRVSYFWIWCHCYTARSVAQRGKNSS